MSIAWNSTVPVDLPPLTHSQRVRLVWRTAMVTVVLVVMFVVFLLVRLCELGLSKLFSRRVRATGQVIVRLWANMTLQVLGLRVACRGTPMRARGAFLANHSSWLDIIVLQRTVAPFLVSKSEVGTWPGIGLIGRCIGTLFIDRKTAAAKKQELVLRQRIEAGDQMALFPEGTSTDGQRVIAFKSSLFAVFFADNSGSPMAAQPVAICYHVQPGLPRVFYGWWGDMDFAGHLRNVMARSTDGLVELHFLMPLSGSDYPNRKAMAMAAECAVRESFGLMRQAN